MSYHRTGYHGLGQVDSLIMVLGSWVNVGITTAAQLEAARLNARANESAARITGSTTVEVEKIEGGIKDRKNVLDTKLALEREKTIKTVAIIFILVASSVIGVVAMSGKD